MTNPNISVTPSQPPKIVKVSQDDINRALAILPPPPVKLVPKKRPRRKIKLPPCIQMIERGITTPGRDVGAFALARFYLSQGLSSEETFGILKVWDTKNRPPLADDHLLETKVESAKKGYGFGCSSITGDPFLSQYCVGESKCAWLNEDLDLEPSITPQSPAPTIDQVRDVVTRNFPESDSIWLATDAALSVFGALLLEDLSHPIALNLQDAPSSWKTTVLDFFAVKNVTYRSDHFTPKSFVSHAASVKKEKLAEIDLLPRIKDRVLIVPEMAPLFGVRKEDLLDNISILTRVFDGQGYLSDSGIQGRRGYSGSYIFGWLGATTPLANSIWFMLGRLGSRWLFLSMNSGDLTEEQLVGMMASRTNYTEKLTECRLAVSSFVTELFGKNAVRSIPWNRSNDSRELLRIIARLADLVRRLRGTIAIWGVEGEHTPPVIEYPPRLTMLLYDLSRGHAIVHGRRQLEMDDICVITEVALSSMPDARQRVFRKLIEVGVLKAKAVMEILKVTRPTALKIMRTMAALDAVIIEEREDMTQVSLLPKDDWLTEFLMTHTHRPNNLHQTAVKGNDSVIEKDAEAVKKATLC